MEKPKMYSGKLQDLLNQFQAYQKERARLEQELIDAGRVNTIHDCWQEAQSVNEL